MTKLFKITCKAPYDINHDFIYFYGLQLTSSTLNNNIKKNHEIISHVNIIGQKSVKKKVFNCLAIPRSYLQLIIICMYVNIFTCKMNIFSPKDKPHERTNEISYQIFIKAITIHLLNDSTINTELLLFCIYWKVP